MFPAWEKTEKQGFSHKSHTCENQDVFKDFLVEPETTTTRGFWGPAGVLPQKRFVFLGSLNLISCNFSTIFSTFISRQKRTFNGQGEGKTIQ